MILRPVIRYSGSTWSTPDEDEPGFEVGPDAAFTPEDDGDPVFVNAYRTDGILAVMLTNADQRMLSQSDALTLAVEILRAAGFATFAEHAATITEEAAA